MSFLRSLVGLAIFSPLIATSAPTAAQPDPIESRVSSSFAFFKNLWPEAGDFVWTDGQRLEFQGGQIKLGRAGLREIIGSESTPFTEVALDFVLAHEAWHSVQARRRTPVEIENLRATRMLECEADFMAGVAVATKLKTSGLLQDSESHVRRDALEKYVRTRPIAGEVATYPPPENRARTISLGWHYVLKPDLFRWGKNSSSLKSAIEISSEICSMIVQISDGSIGSLFVADFRTDLEDKNRPRNSIAGKIRAVNHSKKPITIDYLIVAEWFDLGPREIFQLVRGSTTIAPNATSEMPYRVTGHPVEPDDYAMPQVWSTLVASELRDQGLITARFEPMPENSDSYCYGKVPKLQRSEDRALFSRLATVALAAPHNFEGVRSPTFEETSFSREYKLKGGLGTNFFDGVSVTTYGARASIVAFESSEEKLVIGEFNRLKQLILSVCGAGSIEERGGTSEEPSLWISNFTPSAAISMDVNLWRVKSSGKDPKASPGGIVSFMVLKDDLPE